MPALEVSLEFVQEQDKTLRNEISKSKMRTLIVLLGSSFLLFLWLGFEAVGSLTIRITETALNYGTLNSGIRGRYFVLIPTITNSFGWLSLGMSTYFRLLKSFNRYNTTPSDPFDDTGYREVLDQYHLTKVNYRRQQLVENIVIVIVAIQIAFMCLGPVFAIR